MVIFLLIILKKVITENKNLIKNNLGIFSCCILYNKNGKKNATKIYM